MLSGHRAGLLSALLAFLLLLPVLASAQGVGGGMPGLIADQRKAIAALAAQVDELEQGVARHAEDDARLVDIRTHLEALSTEALASGIAFRPRLAEINARLDQLGPAPGDGAPQEPDIVTLERQALIAEKAEINAVLGVAESLTIRIATLIQRIADMRRDLFQSRLTKRYQIDLALVWDVLAAFETESEKLYTTVSSWLRFVVQFKLRSVLIAAFLALGCATVLLFGGRRLFGSLIEAGSDAADPSYLSRLSVAFWSTLLPSAALAVFLGASYLLFDAYSVLRGDIGDMLVSLFSVIALVYFVHRLAVAALAPSLPNWRLIQVETGAARQLVALVSATAIVTGLDDFLTDVYETMASPLSLTVGESLVATVIIGLLVIITGMIKPFTDEEGNRRPWPWPIRALFLAFGGITLGAAVLGYIGFARFLSQQIVVTGAILATMYIGFLSARAVAEEGAFAGTGVGRRFDRWFKSDEAALDQFGLLASILINITVLLIGVPLILLQWGFRLADIESFVRTAAGGFSVGTFVFSPLGILTGLFVFLLGYFVTRWFQGWLDESVMARGRVDAGVRNSIRTVIGYAGMALAVLVGISAAGINLSNLALVAGGLSLGIGFGLQNVVSNFVSGLILLAERPFKVGDWIVAGSISGTVKKISVRATEIETFQRQTVILPNSELINSAVGNWTHRNKLGRVDIRVNIAYDSDARRAHQIMREVAAAHPLVLRNPEPFVAFSNFGPAALEFDVRIFLADITSGGGVQNDIRFALIDAFAAEGIQMPSTPRAETKPKADWPADDDKAEAELLERAQAEAKEPSRPPTRKPRSRKPDPN